MAENILDTLALEISLKLDNFLRGQKDLEASVQKVQEILAKHGKEVERSTNAAAESVAALARGYQGLFGLLLGGTATAAMYAAKNFAEQFANSNAALGRFAANAGVSPQSASAWGMFAEQFGGGSRESTNATIASLRNQISAMQNSGQLSGEWAKLYGLTNGKGIPFNLQGSTDQLIETAARNMQIAASVVGRPRAIEQGGKLGLDQGTMNAILSFSTWNETKGKLEEIRKSITPTDDMIQKATKLQGAFAELSQTMEKLGNVILENVAPTLELILKVATRLTGSMASQTPSGQTMDLNQSFIGGLTRGPRYTRRHQILDPNQSWLRRNLWPRYVDDPNDVGSHDAAPSSPNSELSHVADAVQKQEGYFAGSRSYRNNNPGNIKYGSFAVSYGATGMDDQGHAIFPSYAAGRAALEGLLKKHSGESLSKIGSWYAEDPNWASGVGRLGGINVAQPLNFSIPPLGAALAQAGNSSTANYNTSHSAVTVNGGISVYANDPGEFKVGVQEQLASLSYANLANRGLQ